jgi:hypothetical protein
MQQLILHLIGDYVTQSDWMAQNKTKSTWAAFCHATIYSLPFLLLASWPAWLLIWSTHLVIDRFRVARFVVYAKNQALSPAMGDLLFGSRHWGTYEELKAQDDAAPQFQAWSDCNATGYHKDVPPWLAVWLMIAADNTLHLAINYSALNWL